MAAQAQPKPITVVGGGLAGAMITLFLAKRGYPVKVIEYRPDFRITQASSSHSLDPASLFGQLTDASKRSINLALSHRGISALKEAGLFDKVQPLLIPMHGRQLHDVQGHLSFVPYGHADQAIYSVSRNVLNTLIVQEFSKYPNVEMIFETKLRGVDRDGIVTLESVRKNNTFQLASSLVIGADGAFSSVRPSLMRHTRVNFSQEFLGDGYKELSISPTADGKFALENPEALHIWGRGSFMIIALPNPDKSFTCTLFQPWDGPTGLSALQNASDDQVMSFFKKNFCDLVPLIPDLLEQWRSNPASPLATIRCNPWHFQDKIVILGDAAHAVCPFFGQGMNCAFEDALELNALFGDPKLDGDISRILVEFTKRRQPAGDALATLSLNNYVEMRYTSHQKWFQIKKKIELFLNDILGDLWIPLYSMVTFTSIPYHVALERSIKQDKIFWSTAAVIAFLLIAVILKVIYSILA